MVETRAAWLEDPRSGSIGALHKVARNRRPSKLQLPVWTCFLQAHAGAVRPAEFNSNIHQLLQHNVRVIRKNTRHPPQSVGFSFWIALLFFALLKGTIQQ